jgi:transposase
LVSALRLPSWFEEYLIPAVPKGTSFVVDSASFHRKNILCDIVESSDSFLISLPTYSPDLNEIEYAVWANMKNYLRNYSRDFTTIDDALIDYFQFR